MVTDPGWGGGSVGWGFMVAQAEMGKAIKRHRVYFKANNLLDETVYSHTSFLSTIPQVGRNFTVGLDFSF